MPHFSTGYGKLFTELSGYIKFTHIEISWSSCKLCRIVFCEVFWEGGSVKGSYWYSQCWQQESDQSPGNLWSLFHWIPYVMPAFLPHHLVILKAPKNQLASFCFAACWGGEGGHRVLLQPGTLTPIRTFNPAAACDPPRGVWACGRNGWLQSNTSFLRLFPSPFSVAMAIVLFVAMAWMCAGTHFHILTPAAGGQGVSGIYLA